MLITNLETNSAAAALLPSLLQRLAPVSHIVHVGVGKGVGAMHQWRQWGVQNALLIDPVSEKWLAPALNGQAGWHHRQTAVAAKQAHAIWHSSSNPAESGLLPPEQLQEVWPNIKTLASETMLASTVDQLVGEQFPDWANSQAGNWLLVDCLPGLPILEGASATLAHCAVVWVRAVLDASLPNLEPAQLDQVQDYLARHQFTRLALLEELHPALGEAVFVRDWPAYMQVMARAEQEAARLAQASPVTPAEMAQPRGQERLDSAADAVERIGLLEAAKAELSEQLQRETRAKQEALLKRDQLAQERAVLLQAQHRADDLAKQVEALQASLAQEQRTAAEAVERATASAVALEQAHLLREQESAAINAQLQTAMREKQEAQQQQASLLQEQAALRASSDEHARLAVERGQALEHLQAEAAQLQGRVRQLDQLGEQYGQQRLLQHEEFIKVEAQVELIKDLLFRESGL